MGTMYLAIPLNEKSAAWLDSEGVSRPSLSAEYRNPTPREIEHALGSLAGYKYEIRRNLEQRTWYADISWAQNPSKGPWTEIVIRDYRADDVPHEFSFSKGWLEVIFLVIERLSRTCGPIVITDDSCALPYLVRPGMALETMINEYNARVPARS